MIPDSLKTEIDKKASTVDSLFESADDEFFWCIRIDDLKDILEKYFEEKTPY